MKLIGISTALYFLLQGLLNTALISGFTSSRNLPTSTRQRVITRTEKDSLAASTAPNTAPVSSSSSAAATTTTESPKSSSTKVTKPNKNAFQNKNNGKKRPSNSNSNGDQKETRKEPWRASFVVSKKTQQKIQNAAEDRNVGRRTPIQRASAVLKALLSTSPKRCNAANVVCALTLSAKIMSSANNNQQQSNDSFRSLLFEALNILHTLVEQKLLNARQLCNAVWAVAKHYDRDPLLLPVPPKTAAISNNEQQVVVTETWDLKVGANDALSPAHKVDATIHQIASQLTDILRSEEERQEFQDYNPDKSTKLGELSMAAWGFGVMRPRHRPPGWQLPPQMSRLPQVANEGTERKDDFIRFEQWAPSNNNDSSNNALQEEDYAAPQDVTDELFDAIGEAICRPLPHDDIQYVSVYEPPFQTMRVSSFTWIELANVAWAFEKHGRCQSPQSEMALRALSREATWRLKSGGGHTRNMLSRDISQLIWALGTLQQDNFRLAHDLVELVQGFSEYLELSDDIEGNSNKAGRPFKDWSCPDIVQVVSALAHARIDDAPLLQSLFKEAHFRLTSGISKTKSKPQFGRKTFQAWEVSVVLWAQARLYLTDALSEIYEKFTNEAIKSIHSAIRNQKGLESIGVGPQEQANIAWALTVLESHQHSPEAVDLLDLIFCDAATSCKENGLIQLEHAHQLWQALYLMEEESPSAVNKVPTWFRNYLEDQWNLEKSRKKTSSARHRSISQALSLMGVAHYNEHEEDIDVAIVLKGQASWTHQTYANDGSSNGMRVAVEFDGPNHFTRQNFPKDGSAPAKVRALGHTVLKYRILKRQGWTVIRVPYYEFDKIPFWASMERQRYLQRLLKTHANIKFSEVDVSEYKTLTHNRKSRFD